jgi:hypothetical protein
MIEEEPSEKKSNVCRVRFKEDAETRWKMEIGGSESACADSLRQTSQETWAPCQRILGSKNRDQ